MSYYTLPCFNSKNIISITNKKYDMSLTLVNYVNECYKHIVDNNYYDFGVKYVFLYPLLNEQLNKNIDMYLFNIIEIINICDLYFDNISIMLFNNGKTYEDLYTFSNVFNNYNTHLYDKFDKSKYNLLLFDEINSIDEFREMMIIIKNNQYRKGNVIFKLKDTYSSLHINFIYMISLFYNKMVIIKPNSGKIFLSERYIVCKDLINYNNYDTINNILSKQDNIQLNIPLFFLNKLEECNTIMGQQQLDCILFINQCNYCKDKPEKLENYYKKIYMKSINWIKMNKINTDNKLLDFGVFNNTEINQHQLDDDSEINNILDNIILNIIK